MASKLTHYLDVVLILNERAETLGLDGAPRLSAFLMSRDLLRAERERVCVQLIGLSVILLLLL